MNGIFITHNSLSLLSYEKLPAAICFVFPPLGPGSLLHGPVKLGFMPSCRVHTGGGTWKVGVRLELLCSVSPVGFFVVPILYHPGRALSIRKTTNLLWKYLYIIGD